MKRIEIDRVFVCSTILECGTFADLTFRLRDDKTVKVRLTIEQADNLFHDLKVFGPQSRPRARS